MAEAEEWNARGTHELPMSTPPACYSTKPPSRGKPPTAATLSSRLIIELTREDLCLQVMVRLVLLKYSLEMVLRGQQFVSWQASPRCASEAAQNRQPAQSTRQHNNCKERYAAFCSPLGVCMFRVPKAQVGLSWAGAGGGGREGRVTRQGVHTSTPLRLCTSSHEDQRHPI